MPPNDVLHPLRTGISYLMEANAPGVVSDEVTLGVNQNGLLLDWTLTLISDPASFPIGATGVTESGLLQDVSADLFIASGLITPIDPGIGVQFPFHVVAASDPLIPEPESYKLLLVGVVGLFLVARRMRNRIRVV